MKKYIRPEIEIKQFEVQDVITASGSVSGNGSLSYTNDEDVVWNGWADFDTLK